MADFKLPELGENVHGGDVLRVLVKAGDTVKSEQPVLELETDKATIEVPSSVAGRVADVKVKSGDKVKVGQTILSVEDGAGGAIEAKAAPAEAKPAPAAAAPAPAKAAEAAAGANTAAKIPAADGLEQHVEGEKREAATDKPGVAREKVVDISRGARPSAESAPPAEERRADRGGSVGAPLLRNGVKGIGSGAGRALVTHSGRRRLHL